MKNAGGVLFGTIFLLGSSVGMAQTSQEIQKPVRAALNYFVGTWTVEVHMKAGAYASRVFFGTEHNEWMPDSSFSRQEGDAAITGGGLSVLAYNPQEKTYTYHVVKSTGETEDLAGTLKDHIWIWTSEGEAAHNHVARPVSR